MAEKRMKQTTISSPVVLTGVGLHTGKQVKLTFKPAPVNHGYVFKRVDLENEPEIPALANFVTTTERGTVLEREGVIVQTTEHVLAACVGLEIDNLLIEINAAEPPIMDGSAKLFVEALEQSGIEEQEEDREEYVVTENIHIKDEENGSEILLIPSDQYEVMTMIDFGTEVLGAQHASLKKLSDFTAEIADARTFVFLHELEELLNHGLIRGGDLDNAIVYVNKTLSPETTDKLRKVFNKEDVSVKPNGILNNIELHYNNEAARHKLLDVIGDLALVGTRIRGKVIAIKPGHLINTNFAKKLERHIKQERRRNIPKVDLNQEPLMDVNQIQKMLPHRPPFLLIDKIFELTDDYVIGTKNVTMNEYFFEGHFPEEPVMPGVLIVEAMAQTGGILILNTVPDPENYLTYFMRMDNVRFKRKVVPGDTLIFKCDLLAPIRRGICHMIGRTYANGHLCAEAELMAQIAKTKNT